MNNRINEIFKTLSIFAVAGVLTVGAGSAWAQVATLTATGNPVAAFTVGTPVNTDIVYTLTGDDGESSPTNYALASTIPGTALQVTGLPAGVTSAATRTDDDEITVELRGTPTTVGGTFAVTLSTTFSTALITPAPTSVTVVNTAVSSGWGTTVSAATIAAQQISVKFLGADAGPRQGATISSLSGAANVNDGYAEGATKAFTVTNLVWKNASGATLSPSVTAFAYGTSYTAVCTLTANAGYTFPTSPVAAQWISGGTAQSATVSANGERLELKAVFAAALAPVKAEELAWLDDEYLPGNGKAVSSYGLPWSLFVPPASEEFVVTSVSWKEFDPETWTAGSAKTTGNFQGGEYYELTVRLTPNSGYTFSGFTLADGTTAGIVGDFLPGAEEGNIAGNVYEITYVYNVPYQVIIAADTTLFWSIPAIAGRPSGEAELANISPADAADVTYTLGYNDLTWRSSNGNIFPSTADFAAGTQYSARITLTAKPGFTFGAASAIDAASFGLPGATIVGTPGAALVLNAPVTALAVVKGTAVGGVTKPRVSGVLRPITGNPADTGVAVTSTAEFSGKVVKWVKTGATSVDESTRPFASGTEYTAEIELTPAAGYTFIGVAADAIEVSGANGATYAGVTNNQSKPKVVAAFDRTNFTGVEIATALVNQVTWDGAGSPATVAIRGTNTAQTAVTSNLNLDAATIAALAANAKVGNESLNTEEIASANISWDSNRRSLISVDGIITRPSADQADSTATLTAIVKSDIGDGTWEKPFVLTVSKYSSKASEDLERVKGALTWSAIRGANSAIQGSPTEVTRNLSLPVNGAFVLPADGDSVQINWAWAKVTADAPSSVFVIEEDTTGTAPRVTGSITRATARSYDITLTATIKNLRSGTTVADQTQAFNLRIMQKGTIPASVIVFEADSAVYTGHPRAIGTASINPLVAGNYAAANGDTTYTYEGVSPTGYPASATPPANAGTYSVVVRIENEEFFGTKTAYWKILPKDIGGAVTVTLEGSNNPSYTYDGTQKRPGVSSVIDSLPLTSADYTVDYRNNTGAGLGVVRIIGRGNYGGEDSSRTFVIARKAVTLGTVTPPAARQYNGTDSIAGVVGVAFNGTVLNQTIPPSQYTVAAKYNSANAGADSITGTIVLDDTGATSRNYTLASDVLAIQLPANNRITKRTLGAGDFVWFYNDSLNAAVPTGHRAGRAAVGAGEPSLKLPLSSATSALTALYTVRANVDSVAVPNVAGTYPVKVKLKDAVAVAASNYNVGADSSVTVTISNYVIGNPVPPVVVTQPADTTVRVGGTVTVSVNAVTPDSAIGGVVAYQWYKNRALIEGATGATYMEPANTVVGAKDTFYVFVKNVVAGIQHTDSVQSGSAVVSTLKAAVSITFANVVVDTQYTYNGKAQIPSAAKVKVILDGVTLANGTDYTFSTRDSLDAGTARVIVTGLYDYKDVAEGTYRINRKALEKGDLAVSPPSAIYNTLPQAVGIRVTDRDGAARTGLGKETVSYRNTDTTKNPDSLKTTTAPVEAGEYEITVTVANDGLNFTGTPADSAFNLGVYTIRRKTVEDSDILLNGAQFTGILPSHLYTGDTLGIGAIELKGTNDGTAAVVYVRNGASVAPVEAGVYTVRVNISGYNNYTAVTYSLGTYTIAGPAELVAAAKARIEATAFGPVADSAANTEAKAKAFVEGVIAGLDLGDVAAVVSGAFTAATAEAAGSYVFTVALSLESAAATTASKTVVISQKVSVASNDRVIPGSGSEVVVVAPVQVVAGEFTVGPNPVAKASGKVGFFWQGKAVKSGTLYVFDASGNLVTKVAVSDKGSTTARREIGSWNLTAKGAPVSEGTYLVKGALVGKDGGKVRVSSILGVAR